MMMRIGETLGDESVTVALKAMRNFDMIPNSMRIYESAVHVQHQLFTTATVWRPSKCGIGVRLTVASNSSTSRLMKQIGCTFSGASTVFSNKLKPPVAATREEIPSVVHVQRSFFGHGL
jgi:hypothetical protein